MKEKKVPKAIQEFMDKHGGLRAVPIRFKAHGITVKRCGWSIVKYDEQNRIHPIVVTLEPISYRKESMYKDKWLIKDVHDNYKGRLHFKSIKEALELIDPKENSYFRLTYHFK